MLYYKVLEKKGFGYKWRTWMWSCIRNVNCSILLNGASKGSIKGQRLLGLRQGPFIPFLVLTLSWMS